jgi:Resolvase, N terminal domain
LLSETRRQIWTKCRSILFTPSWPQPQLLQPPSYTYPFEALETVRKRQEKGIYQSLCVTRIGGGSYEPERVAIYARVSTLHSQNPEMQLAELREYAARRGWEVTAEYVDLGVSGSRESRPELNRMLADAHSRAFDAVVWWKLDRLGRSLKHLVTTIEELSAYECDEILQLRLTWRATRHLGVDSLVMGFYRRKDPIHAARVRAGLVPATRRKVEHLCVFAPASPLS